VCGCHCFSCTVILLTPTSQGAAGSAYGLAVTVRGGATTQWVLSLDLNNPLCCVLTSGCCCCCVVQVVSWPMCCLACGWATLCSA
jgi:hypothetical protein